MTSLNDPLQYSMLVFWSEEDSAYLVEVPELPGCMADGSTYEEAVENAQMVMSLWIETAVEKGWAIPEPRLGRLGASGEDRSGVEDPIVRSLANAPAADEPISDDEEAGVQDRNDVAEASDPAESV